MPVHAAFGYYVSFYSFLTTFGYILRMTHCRVSTFENFVVQVTMTIKFYSILLTNIPLSVGLVTHFSFIIMEHLYHPICHLPPTYNKPQPLLVMSGWPAKLLLSL